MRRIPAMLALVFLGAIFAAGPAHAASSAASGTTIDPTELELQQCLGDQPIGGQPPSCTFDENGHLIGRSTTPSSGGGFNLAPFIVIALIWSAVPLVIAAAVARSRNEPIGSALALTVVLGWIGLLIVFYGQRRTSDDVSRFVRGSPPPASQHTVTERPWDDRGAAHPRSHHGRRTRPSPLRHPRRGLTPRSSRQVLMPFHSPCGNGRA